MSEFHGLGGIKVTQAEEKLRLCWGRGREREGKEDVPFTKSPASQGHLDNFMAYQKVKGTSRRGQML